MQNRVVRLLDGKASTGVGATFSPHSAKKAFQAIGRTTAGSGSAIIKIQGSLTGGASDTEWVDVATITLTLGTTATTDGFASDSVWAYIRPNVTTLTGTGASVDLYMGIEDRSHHGHCEGI
jgi:hypothetical protein